MDHSLVGSVLSGGIALLAFAFGYGSVTARIKTLESQIEHSVTKQEFRSLERRIDELSDEIKGLRSEILGILKTQLGGHQ